MSRANEMAFPVTPTDRSGQIAETQYGLTIREHFAALAMQGLAACHGTAGLNRGVAETAERAVQLADATIAELAKVKP